MSQLAVENSGDPFYEGASRSFSRKLLSHIYCIISCEWWYGPCKYRTQFAGMKIRDAGTSAKDLGIEDGKSIFENMKILGMNYELEKAAIENASIRLTEEQETSKC